MQSMILCSRNENLNSWSSVPRHACSRNGTKVTSFLSSFDNVTKYGFLRKLDQRQYRKESVTWSYWNTAISISLLLKRESILGVTVQYFNPRSQATEMDRTLWDQSWPDELHREYDVFKWERKRETEMQRKRQKQRDRDRHTGIEEAYILLWKVCYICISVNVHCSFVSRS